MTMRSVILLFLLVFLPLKAMAVQPDEVLSDPALESRARALSADLRCLVCQNQSIDDSDAPLARDLRLLLRERLVAGDSDQQVIAFLVDRYGEFVLLKPRFGLHTLVLWMGPFVILFAAFIIAWRARARVSVTQDPTAVTLSLEEQEKLKKLIKSDD